MRPNKKEFAKRKKDAKKAAKCKQRERDKHARKETGIRSAREARIFVAPKMIKTPQNETEDERILSSARNCYVCKAEYNKLHHFYDSMYKKSEKYTFLSFAVVLLIHEGNVQIIIDGEDVIEVVE